MALMVRGDVLELPNARFKAFAARLLDAGFVRDVLVCENGLDVGSEDYGAAGEVAQSEDSLKLVASGLPLPRKFDRRG